MQKTFKNNMYVNHINIMCKAFLLKKEEEEEIKTQELLKKNQKS